MYGWMDGWVGGTASIGDYHNLFLQSLLSERGVLGPQLPLWQLMVVCHQSFWASAFFAPGTLRTPGKAWGLGVNKDMGVPSMWVSSKWMVYNGKSIGLVMRMIYEWWMFHVHVSLQKGRKYGLSFSFLRRGSQRKPWFDLEAI